MDMLGSLKLFLTYESLDEDFEEYDCESPLPYEELTRKTVQETASKVRKNGLSNFSSMLVMWRSILL